jgi:hypothetical protein
MLLKRELLHYKTSCDVAKKNAPRLPITPNKALISINQG